jgi:hypothetical protein
MPPVKYIFVSFNFPATKYFYQLFLFSYSALSAVDVFAHFRGVHIFQGVLHNLTTGPSSGVAILKADSRECRKNSSTQTRLPACAFNCRNSVAG